jgi:hypothetical protein
MALPVVMFSAFGVLEFWSIGELEKAKTQKRFNLKKFLHDSITPPLHYSS